MPISDYILSIRAQVGTTPLLLPSIAAVVIDNDGRVLLQRSPDDGKWHQIGGMIEAGEEPALAAIREVKEETNLDIIPERVSGVYAWPTVTYPNGDVCHYTAIAFRCRVIGGSLQINDDESLELQFFHPTEFPELGEIEQLCIRHALEQNERAQFTA